MLRKIFIWFGFSKEKCAPISNIESNFISKDDDDDNIARKKKLDLKETIYKAKKHFNSLKDNYYTPVELGGLYWHLVDLIWIYLFPLLYLV
mgnify:CR=1 FL=1